MNATIADINASFAALIIQRGVYRRLCNANDAVQSKRMRNKVNTVRNRMKEGRKVTIDLKVKWLVRSGWRPGKQDLYTKGQVVTLLERAAKMNKQARAMGGAYLLETLTR